MLSLTQHERIARKCTNTLSRAIDALPAYLADMDSESAAKLVADLIKAYIHGPFPEPDPGAALAEAIRRAQSDPAPEPVPWDEA